jgi:hypothetical protein
MRRRYDVIPPPPIVDWPGAAAEGISFGKRLLPRSASVRVAIPGSFVWGGYDHALRRGIFIPTHLAWERGEQAMAPLPERESFDPMPGFDDVEIFSVDA